MGRGCTEGSKVSAEGARAPGINVSLLPTPSIIVVGQTPRHHLITVADRRSNTIQLINQPMSHGDLGC